MQTVLLPAFMNVNAMPTFSLLVSVKLSVNVYRLLPMLWFAVKMSANEPATSRSRS